MSYCFNPNCQKPENPSGTKYCQSCGTAIALLKNRYRIVRPLGQGGFGKTFLAEDTDRRGANCVVKQFAPAPGMQSNPEVLKKATELFYQESDRLLQLDEHPQIPTLFDYFEENSCLYLVQQFIKGKTLLDELEEHGTFNEQKIRELLQDLLPVLEFVHEHKVIHRDIKPENIIRRQVDRKLVLIDFGVAKQGSGTLLTQAGTTVGTPGYAPMEQMRGVTYPASDLYSLGVTCIRLLTGCFAKHDGSDELYDNLESCWLWRDKLPPDTTISSELGLILDRMLQDLVKQRYRSAAEVLTDLNQPTKPTLPTVEGNIASPDTDDASAKLDELDLAVVRGLASYFEMMYDKILKYYRDHNASKEEADVIAKYYYQTASNLRTVNTQEDLKEILDFIEDLKQKVSRYQHEKSNYRWSIGLEKEVLEKLRKIVSPSVTSGATSNISPSSPNPVNTTTPTSALQNFEFEVVTLKLVQLHGFLGTTSSIQTSRSRKQAQFFTENLGGSVILEMVSIPGGTFMMGSPPMEEGRSDRESPQHHVTVAPIFMSKYAITQEQYETVMGDNPSRFKGKKRPVENVFWKNANEFCQKLFQTTGNTYRLQSEAEWEYACRAGTRTPFNLGETITTEVANYDGNYAYASTAKGIYLAQTRDVGSFPANAFGLYDMHGNVWEWCADPWHENYHGAPSDGSVWELGGDDKKRLLRGGSWFNVPNYCRSAYRQGSVPDLRDKFIGFRVVVSP